MARPRRLLLRLILLAMVLIVAAAAALPLLPLSPLQPAVELRLSEALGRKVMVESLRASLIGGPHFTITGMTIQEDPAFGDQAFLKADEVRADLDLIQFLLRRKVVVDAMTLTSPQLRLVRNADGSWNWTTLGRQSHLRAANSDSALNLSSLWVLWAGESSSASFNKIRVENAAVRVVDHSSTAAEILYGNIGVDAALTPAGGREAESEGGRQAIGEFTAQSVEDGRTELLRATLPFDLTIERRSDAALVTGGSIGPGPLETKNLSVGSFSINGQISADRAGPLTGTGQLVATEMLIRPINLSERVAGALRVSQIGDMNPGTHVGGIEGEFRISQGAVDTIGLRIQGLDGLGDATAQNGRFKIDSGLTVDYRATVTLSADATSRLKSAGTLLGIIAAVLETNNRLSVPININGDLRKPQVYVDVSRIF